MIFIILFRSQWSSWIFPIWTSITHQQPKLCSHARTSRRRLQMEHTITMEHSRKLRTNWKCRSNARFRLKQFIMKSDKTKLSVNWSTIPLSEYLKMNKNFQNLIISMIYSKFYYENHVQWLCCDNRDINVKVMLVTWIMSKDDNNSKTLPLKV